MEETLRKFSNDLYQKKFKRVFKEEEWEMAKETKKKGKKCWNTYYIGSGYDEYFWEGRKGQRKQFLIKIIEEITADERREYSVSFLSNKIDGIEREEIVEIGNYLKNILKKAKVDILLDCRLDVYTFLTIATGKNSENVLKIRDKIREYYREIDTKGGNYQIVHTEETFSKKENVSKGTVTIENGEEIIPIKNENELGKWIEEKVQDTRKIKNIHEEVRTKLKQEFPIRIRLDTVWVDDKERIRLEIKRTKKNTYKALMQVGEKEEKQKEYKTLEEVANFAFDEIETFKKTYRLKKVTGA